MSMQAIQSFTFLKSSRFLFQFTRLPNILSNLGINLTNARTPATTTLYEQDNSLENLDEAVFRRDVGFICDSIEFPGQTITPTNYRIPGTKEIKVPYLRDFSEITASFLYPETIPMYDFFTAWITNASPRSTQNNFFDDIVGQGRITQFMEGNESSERDIDGQAPYLTVNLQNMYPLSFASMQSNWADDGFHRISVTFFFENISINTYTRKNPETAIPQMPSDTEFSNVLLQDPSLANLGTIKF